MERWKKTLYALAMALAIGTAFGVAALYLL